MLYCFGSHRRHGDGFVRDDDLAELDVNRGTVGHLRACFLSERHREIFIIALGELASPVWRMPGRKRGKIDRVGWGSSRSRSGRRALS